MPERRSTRHLPQRRRGNDSSGAFDKSPGSTLIQFSVVEIREFERVVGDNPSCSSGVPVSIGWNHGKTFKMDLEDFEKARPPRRSQMDLVLTRGERHRLLVEWGASGQDVIEAIRMIIRVKNQRRQTVNNLGSYDKVEEVFENIGRRFTRFVCRTSSTSVAMKLKVDSERAAASRKNEKGGSEAASYTANETATASSLPHAARREASAGSNRGRRHDDEPPFSEVSVMKNGSDASTHSDPGYLTSDSMKKAPPEASLGSPRPPRPKHTPRHEEQYNHPKHEMDNDLDNMSNPQSHDHRGHMELQAVNGSVDI
ncbi:expressed unknown protein [Seminavis robusta]|uniref:Uncharacterized protein n=1 Tax=Seminavis robusta TaxID=568900 RepID=A0A9N8DD81_9STRA|nr:expressed unknown protein [Seminavis robusta]|eukprot:Sro70_g038800.1 n/a (312) ;mRNA; r:24486-25665